MTKGKGRLALGALIGASLGVLFAPRKGSETRGELKKKINELIEKAKETNINEVSDIIEGKINEIKTELALLDKEKVLNMAREKGELIKVKAKELVELAKAKGTPILKDASIEVEEKTIQVVKEVLARLEKDKEERKAS